MSVYCQMAESEIPEVVCLEEQSFDNECAGCRVPSRRCQKCGVAKGIKDAKKCLCSDCLLRMRNHDELNDGEGSRQTVDGFVNRLRTARLVKLPSKIVVAQNAYRHDSIIEPIGGGDTDSASPVSAIDAFAILCEHARERPRGDAVVNSPFAVLEARLGVVADDGEKLLVNMERNNLFVWNRSENLLVMDSLPKAEEVRVFARERMADEFAWCQEQVATQVKPITSGVEKSIESVPDEVLVAEPVVKLETIAIPVIVEKAEESAKSAPMPAVAPEKKEIKLKRKKSVNKSRASKTDRLPINYPCLRPEGVLLVKGRVYGTIKACSRILGEDRSTLVMAFNFGQVRFFPAFSQKNAIMYAYSVNDLRRCCARVRENRKARRNTKY